MSLWRLEWLRLIRAYRLLALFAPFVFFGLTTPLLTKYLGEILKASGGGQLQVTTPPPTPAASLSSYMGNVAQIGLLVFALVLASALAVGAHKEIAVFLRTRVSSPAGLVVPRYVVTVAAGCVAFLVGTACTWAGTVILIGSVDPGGLVMGAVFVCVYLAFIGSVTAVIATRFDSVLAAAAITLGVALVLALVGSVQAIGTWLPSKLVGSVSALGSGTGSPGDYLAAVVVSVAVTIGLLALAVRLSGLREL